MKKGFTLIELLAVIAILAIIAVITTPVVTNVINSSKEKAFIQSAYSLVEAAQNYQANNGYSAYEFDFTDADKSYEKLEIEGDYPDKGYLSIDENGKVDLALWNEELQICVEKEKETKLVWDEEKQQNVEKEIIKKTIKKVDKQESECKLK